MNKFCKILGAVGLSLCFSLSLAGCSSEPDIYFVERTGKSAYELAVENGFVGTLDEWLDSLKAESAYDIAVKNGFVGTELEWLASLKGDKGENGTPGTNGTNGTNAHGVTARELFQMAVERGLYEDDPEGNGFSQFLKDYVKQINPDALSTSAEVQKVAAKCVNQVVSIYCPIPGDAMCGSGVIYKLDKEHKVAYIITNYHVVSIPTNKDTIPTGSQVFEPSPAIYCYMYGNETFSVSNGSIDYGSGKIEATYVGGAAEYDLAVIKITGTEFDKLSKSASAITTRDTNNIQLGETAIAIGNPFGEGIGVSAGYIRTTSKYISPAIANEQRIIRVMGVDTPINSGNSGGGVFDDDGKFIGIANAKLRGSDVSNYAYAIPGTNVINVADNLIYFHEKALLDGTLTDKTVGVHKYLFGFTISDENKSNHYDEITGTNRPISQITIQDIKLESIASKMGLQVGDVIHSLNIKRNGVANVYDNFQFGYQVIDHLLTLRPDDEISMTIIRGNNEGSPITTVSHTVTLENYLIIKNNASR